MRTCPPVSGRLDLDQQPCGPQPDGSSAAQVEPALESGLTVREVGSAALSLDPELDPVGSSGAKAEFTIATSCADGA